ncbi:serine/threonine-protein kinase [soil metagenome]
MLDLLDRLQVALQGRYTVEREIGHGGMAVVYLSRDIRHDRVVALKVLQPQFTEVLGPERFLREIKLAARLRHPNLLPLYDSGEAGGFLYYVCPYVEGGSLRDRLLGQGRVPLPTTLRLAREVAEALDYAHRHQVIHRDIKPENILLDEGHAIVADFGVARAVSAAAGAGLTETGMLVGTPAYMSPEQVSDAPLDGRSDIYALGCVIFEMLVGRPPFTGTAPLMVLAQRLVSVAPSLRSAGAAVPAAVEHLVARSLAASLEDRFQTATDLTLALSMAERELTQGIPTPRATRPVPRVASLAVLPFVNMSTDPENEFFSDGMTEELINALTRVQGLQVTSRTSVFAYKGRDVDIREIGHRLNVGAVLEGSVRRVGNRLRVTAQLVNAIDGYHLWSETYDRQLADVFELQDELSRAIVSTLKPKLVGVDSQPLVLPPTNSVEAYTAYLKGRFFWNKRTLDGYRRGIAFFEHALVKDPGLALAHSGIADCWAMLAFDYFGGVPPREGMPKARAAALRALELDEGLAEGRTPLAVVSMLYEWDFAAAERHFELALELKPGYYPARMWYSHLLSVMGRHEESLDLIRRTLEQEPLALIVQQSVARILHFAGRYEESIEECRRLLEMDSDFVTGYELITRPLCAMGRYEEAEHAAMEGVVRSGRWSLLLGALGCVFGYAGKADAARGILTELEEQGRRRYVPRNHVALVHYGLRDEAKALEEVARCVQERSGVLVWSEVDLNIRWLVTNPRFQQLLRDRKQPG